MDPIPGLRRGGDGNGLAILSEFEHGSCPLN